MSKCRQGIFAAIAAGAAASAIMFAGGAAKAPTADRAADEGKTAESRARDKAEAERLAKARRRPSADTRPLYFEGGNVVDLEGYVLSMKQDLHIKGAPDRSAFQPVDGGPYIVFLECKLLDRLEQFTRHGEKLVRVSGTAYIYENRNYLLLSRAYVKPATKPD